MAGPTATYEQLRALARGWEATGRELDRRRFAELAAQTPEESRAAAFDMLQLGGMLPPDPRREATSGFVEMRRILDRGRPRGPS
jgi:hypothetical protein